MIERVLQLQKDGIEQPQFFGLVFRYADMGEGYDATTLFGTEAHLRDVLKKGGLVQADIDRLFRDAF